MALARGLIGSLPHALDPLLQRYAAAVRPAHRPLLRALLLGLLRHPAPYVSEVARSARELGPTLAARERRLLRFLASPRLDLAALQAAHRERVRRCLPRKRRILAYADLSDISKPWARRLEALDVVRDASDPDKRLRPGYWLNEIYLTVGRGRVLPVVFDLFSLKAEGVHSQNAVVLAGLEAAFAVTGDRGILVADRGYDNGRVFAVLVSAGRDFIIRLQAGTNSRHLQPVAGGPPETVEHLLARLPRPHRLSDDAAGPWAQAELGWAPVTLPAHPDHPLTLLVLKDRNPEPIAVLTSLPVPDRKTARWIVRAYLGRWSGAEDPIRFVKQAFRLEKFLLGGLRAMQTWIFLMGVALSLLTALLAPDPLRRNLLAQIEQFRERVDFLYYRMVRVVALVLAQLVPRDWAALVRGPSP